MKSFDQFLEQGTYVSVVFSDETNETLHNYALKLGLKPIDKFHATVVYSPKRLRIPYGESYIEDVNDCYIESIDYLGDKDSEWRAVVLKIKSDTITNLYNYYVQEYGYVHSYDSFIPHISLAYKPPEDLDLSSLELPQFRIKLIKQIIEPLV